MQCTCVYYDVGEWSHVYCYVVVCPQSCGMSDLANYAFAASPTHHTS